MSSEIRNRLYELYRNYAVGRLDAVAGMLDDDIEFVSYAPVDVFPYLGRHRGRGPVAQAMLKAHSEFEYLSYQPVFMVVEKDDAAVILLARLKQNSTGRIVQLFIANFLRFRDGRIYELREFLDSFDAVEQVLGREITLPKPG